jgi:hypothetical protein
MRRKGRGWIAAGELNPMAKLTAQTVMAIRAAKGSQRKIAKRFAVSQALVSLIKLGDRWRGIFQRLMQWPWVVQWTAIEMIE